MKNTIKNAMIIGAVSAVAGYSMYKQTKNRKTPLNRAKNMISKTTHMF